MSFVVLWHGKLLGGSLNSVVENLEDVMSGKEVLGFREQLENGK